MIRCIPPLFPVLPRPVICPSSRGRGSIRSGLDITPRHCAQYTQAQDKQQKTCHHVQTPSLTSMGVEAGHDAIYGGPSALSPLRLLVMAYRLLMFWCFNSTGDTTSTPLERLSTRAHQARLCQRRCKRSSAHNTRCVVHHDMVFCLYSSPRIYP